MAPLAPLFLQAPLVLPRPSPLPRGAAAAAGSPSPSPPRVGRGPLHPHPQASCLRRGRLRAPHPRLTSAGAPWFSAHPSLTPSRAASGDGWRLIAGAINFSRHRHPPDPPLRPYDATGVSVGLSPCPPTLIAQRSPSWRPYTNPGGYRPLYSLIESPANPLIVSSVARSLSLLVVNL